ncbi:MAG TPA: helix-turn-helix domain-containing protein [Verrucomicrobiae bacterium]|nr:helix-turn-helix domain-containing protein [Verrucomicrobiae bacterium]
MPGAHLQGECVIHTSSIPHGFILQTRDLDEAATLLGDSAIPYVSELLPGSPPFSTKIFVTRGQQVTLSRVVTSGNLRVEATLPGDAYALLLDLRGGVGLHRAHAQNITVNSEFALLQSPLETVEAFTPAEFEALFIRFSRKAVVSELNKLLNREIHAKLEFAPALRLKTSAGQRLRAICGELRRILYSTDGHEVSGSVAIRSLEDELLRLILETQPHNYTRLLHRGNQAGARQIADAEEYMRANAHLPLTLGDVCQAAGVNARTLQNAFRHNRGSTPMQFLRTIRMQEVRAGLLTPHPETSVSREAARWGFLHFGRFSGEYRSAYGELPSETLKRARRVRG